MNLSEVTIGCDEADFTTLLEQWWSWLLPNSYRPLFMTVFGDWFLMDETGKIFFLDLLEGCANYAAESKSELETMIADDDKENKWFLPGFVIAMRQKGIIRQKGECYAYKVHPIIGGKLESSNLTLLSIRVWQAICSQIHQQVRALPVGTPIVGMEYLEEWKIRLLTADTCADGSSPKKTWWKFW